MHAAAMIIEDRHDRVLLLRRGPTAPWMPMRWNLPGGKIESYETSANAAARETREETNLRVDALRPLVRMRGHGGLVLDVYYAERWSGRLRLADREHVEYVWAPRAEAQHFDLVPPQEDILRWYAERS